jgi:hypothetical protein
MSGNDGARGVHMVDPPTITDEEIAALVAIHEAEAVGDALLFDCEDRWFPSSTAAEAWQFERGN